jgi:cell fate regulator YaaT (PSP1 superfamily)
MPNVVGIRFKPAGKIYNFDAAQMALKVGDQVVVKTSRGLELGTIAIAPKEVPQEEIKEELKPVMRKAEPEDIKRSQDLAAKEKEALEICAKLVAQENLPMKLVSAEYSLDGSRATIYFSAEERVDFRKLVRELNAALKTRVELRQIGPRDEAKMVGGYGRCGRRLCCASFIREFDPVSIRMAKDQDLPLDPMKISGVCGRLLCCLGYEHGQYREMKEAMPHKGQTVNTPAGTGRVVSVNPLKETVFVELESQATIEVPAAKATVVGEQTRLEDKDTANTATAANNSAKNNNPK